jgi:peptide/nickel transport system permease protein
LTRYIFRRLALAVLILWFISIAVFLLLRVGGGDPTLLQQGMSATPERIAEVRLQLHLDDPYPLQYLRWMKQVLTFNFGQSLITQTNVTDEFKARLPVSLQLMLMTVAWTVLLGIPFGIISAVRRNGAPDYFVRIFAVLGLSMPAFWVATLVLMIPAQAWGYAPPLSRTTNIFTDPWTNIRQLGPPSLVLALSSTASVMRLTRSQMLEALRADYIRTARAKGMKERSVVLSHALRNSLIPVVTVLGLLSGGLLGGSVVMESIFNLRGLGQYIYSSILLKDFAVVQSLVMFTASVAVLMNLTVDLSYAVLDPRIRYNR